MKVRNKCLRKKNDDTGETTQIFLTIATNFCSQNFSNPLPVQNEQLAEIDKKINEKSYGSVPYQSSDHVIF